MLRNSFIHLKTCFRDSLAYRLLAVLLLLGSTLNLGEAVLTSCPNTANAFIASPCMFSPGLHLYTSLTIQSEVFLETTALLSQHIFNVSQTLDIKPEAIITLGDNKEVNNNPGAGVDGNTGGSGGSFGGRGGSASHSALTAVQALPYGSAFTVTQAGSSGGGNPSTRGKGGGLIKLYARKLILDGTVQAGGGRAQQNDGGGSGGGVAIDCFEIDGDGRVEAPGGLGSGRGGGGGGGRISVVFERGSFRGKTQAYGGKTGKMAKIAVFCIFFSLSKLTDHEHIRRCLKEFTKGFLKRRQLATSVVILSTKQKRRWTVIVS